MTSGFRRRHFRFFDLRHRRVDEHPTHAEAFRFEHGDLQIAELAFVARRDFATDARLHVAADPFFGRLADVDLQSIREIFDQVIAAHAIATVAERFDLRPLAIEFVLNLPEQLLGDVLEGHDAAGAAVLIDHDRHVRFLFDELRQQRFDGNGYPDNLAGEEIPLGARIIHVADAFDSMLTTRVYRPARPAQDALA